MSATPASYDVRVRRGDLRDAVVVERPVPTAAGLEPGTAALRVERFALTANNVTYGVFGDAPGFEYFRFWPAAEGRGIVPVWGFATVVASAHPAVAAGERFYGFWPMATHAVLRPADVGPAGLVDAAPHRTGLAPLYNTYVREARRPGDDPARRAAADAEAMLLRPLFGTAFLIDDFLADAGFFGARRVLVGSASSKTAYATAFLLSRRRGTPASVEVVGLTSTRNVGFVERLGCYDRVLDYGAIDALEPDVPTVYVDMSGDAAVRGAVHRRLGDALRHDCAVGATHWDRGAAPSERGELPGPRPQLFFAPGRWRTREADWGAAGLAARMGEARAAFGERVCGDGGWMTVVEGRGPVEVVRVWRELVDGGGRPDEGHVLVPDPA